MVTIREQSTPDPVLMMEHAHALQVLVKSFETGVGASSNTALFQGQFIAAPVLLALAMELALKAWWTRENENSDVPRTHDLLILFDKLNEDTRTRLQGAHPEVPALPEIPNSHRIVPPIRLGLRSILAATSNTFTHWRYQHELSRGDFPSGEFGEALSAVIREFGRAAQDR